MSNTEPTGNLNTLSERLPHRAPFKFADRIVRLEAGEYIEGHKFISHNEPSLQGHFPDQPIFPGVLIIETMAQISGLCFSEYSAGVLSSIDKAKFLRPVVPGDILVIKSQLLTRLEDMALFQAIAYVGEEEVARAKVSIHFSQPVSSAEA